ncbi:MAG: response regulator [Desulfovibrio sp.]|nr:MAG: response regulator [Desulfovibrio sp.]
MRRDVATRIYGARVPPRKRNSRLSKFLPSSTYLRFLLATLVAALFTGALALGLSYWTSRNTVHELQDEAGFTLLRNTVDLIGRTRIAFEEQRNSYYEEHKDTLRTISDYTANIIDSYAEQVRLGDMTPDQARNAAFDLISRSAADIEHTVFIINGGQSMVAHTNPWFRHSDMDTYRDLSGETVFRTMAGQARLAGDGKYVFRAYPWLRHDNGVAEYKLALARYYREWDIVIFCDLALGDVETALSDARQASLSEMRARLREITIARNGYIFVFDEACNMIAHPTLEGGDFASMPLPGSDTTMCQALKDTAERPWGENRLTYTWDRPDDSENYAHEKVSWCIREPTTGWYVAASAYIDEIESAMARFMRAIAIPALLSILILGLGLAVLLRRLLKPVHQLAQVCEQVGQGDLSARASEDAPGEVGFLCIHFNKMVDSLADLRDKDEERRMELEHLNRNLERIVGLRTRALERKAHKLEELNVQLRELDAMKSTFLSSVSHELRTPLTSIRGFAKLISKEFSRHFLGSFPDDRHLSGRALRIQQNLEIIGAEGERLTRLINDVLDLAKIESGQMDWRDSTFDFKELIDHCVRSLTGLISRKPDLRVRVLVPNGLPQITADRDRFTQLFINLINNAVKFTEKGQVLISACLGQDGLQCRIRDTGPGIDTVDLLPIFDKFHQAVGSDTLQDKPRGTGLGLAICHNVVSRYDGLIWAESTVGLGAELVVELPRKLFGKHPVPLERPRPMPLDAFSDTAPRILVVDDEPYIRTYLGQVFESEGYRVDFARNGNEALAKAREHPPGLVTMDLQMPGMDGRVAVQEFKADPALRHIPLVIISIMYDRNNVGGDASLDKPVDEDKLLVVVNDLIRKHHKSMEICLLLSTPGAEPTPQADICGELLICDSLEDFRAHIQSGFSGTVLLPASMSNAVDLEELAQNRNIHVVIRDS